MEADRLISTLFDEWAVAYTRGERPDPRSYLDRAGTYADALAGLMERYLAAAPRPVPTEEDVDLVAAWMRGDSPLAELRSRRGITRDRIITTIVERFGLRPEQRASVKEHYHQLESGLLDPSRLSRRLSDLLSETLGVSAGALGSLRTRQIQTAAAFRDFSTASIEDRIVYEAPADDAEVRSLFLSDE